MVEFLCQLPQNYPLIAFYTQFITRESLNEDENFRLCLEGQVADHDEWLGTAPWGTASIYLVGFTSTPGISSPSKHLFFCFQR